MSHVQGVRAWSPAVEVAEAPTALTRWRRRPKVSSILFLILFRNRAVQTFHEGIGYFVGPLLEWLRLSRPRWG